MPQACSDYVLQELEGIAAVKMKGPLQCNVGGMVEDDGACEMHTNVTKHLWVLTVVRMIISTVEGTAEADVVLMNIALCWVLLLLCNPSIRTHVP